jgi:hypothetical protein
LTWERFSECVKVPMARFLRHGFSLVLLTSFVLSCSGPRTKHTPQEEPSIATWKDASTGLEWQLEPTGGRMEWMAALNHCKSLGKGWHLPDISELRSLIRGCPMTELGGSCGLNSYGFQWQNGVRRPGCLSWSCRSVVCDGCDPAPGCYWPAELQGKCDWYWSSSPDRDYGGAWFVEFSRGFVASSDGGSVLLVRCVRY